jgi:hypothetical protein
MEGGAAWSVTFPYMMCRKLPFAAQEAFAHIPVKTRSRRKVMNWIFEAYANVYRSAMLDRKDRPVDAALANKR